MRLQQEIDMDNQEYMDWLFHTFHPLMWHTAKKYLFMLVMCLVFCLASALVVFLVLRPLFAVG